MKKYIPLICLFLLSFPLLLNAQEKKTTPPTEKVVFTNNPDQLHYAIIRLESIEKGKTNEPQKLEVSKQEKIAKQINTLNNKVWKSDLRQSQIYLSGGEKTEPVVTIRRFENFQEAQKYCSAFAAELNNTSERDQIVEILPISQMNYRACLKLKSSEDYRKYYSEVLEAN